MKRRRNIGIIVLLVILAFMAFAIITPSIMQNNQVRKFADQLFLAYQNHDVKALNEIYYRGQGVHARYYQLVETFSLLGWKIKRVSGQPYPLDIDGFGEGGSYIFNSFYADLYYKPVEKLIKPKGYVRIKHPVYGDCMVVPVTVTFSYHPELDGQWIIKPPDSETGEFWVLPFEKRLPKPLEGLKF